MDNHGMKFVVDTTGVAKGFRDYKSAVDGIFKSLDKFEAHVTKTMKGVASAANNKAALGSFKKGLEEFANVKVDPKSAKNISALGAAMAGFKAPSASQSGNMRSFFKALGGLPDLGRAYKSIKAIDDLNIAMRGFKAPPASQAANLVKFANAFAAAATKFKGMGNMSNITNMIAPLNSLSAAFKNLKTPTAGQIANLAAFATAMRSFQFPNMTNTAGFFATLAQLSKFKAPSLAQTKNLQAFITAISGLQIPRNAMQVAKALEAIARAAAMANGSLGGLRGTLGGLNGRLTQTGSAARGATMNMMGLQNAFSGTFQIGSLLRSLLGSLTIAELGRNFFTATNKAEGFRAAMSVISKEAGFADQQLNYVRETANRFGLDMLVSAESFSKFALSASGAGASLAETKFIFEGFATQMTVMNLAVDKQQNVWLALSQAMNKGYIAAEELNGQLNEYLPGSMGVLNAEIKRVSKGTETVFTAMEKKIIDAKTAMIFLAKDNFAKFGPALEKSLSKPNAQFAILKNNINSMFMAMGDAGATAAFGNMLKRLNTYLSPEKVAKFADVIGKKLAAGADKAAAAIDYLYQNWDKIKGPLATTLSLLGKWMIVSGALNIGRSLTSPLLIAGGAARGLIPNLQQLITLMRTLSTMAIVTPIAAGGGAALTGGFASALAGINAVKMAIANFSWAGFVGATRTAMTGTRGLILGAATAIVAGLGGAFATATMSANEFSNENYTITEVMKGYWIAFTDLFSGAWTSTMEYVDGVVKWFAASFSVDMSGLGELAGKTLFVLGFTFKTTFEAIGRGVGAIINGIANQISLLGGALTDLKNKDFSAAGSKALDLVTMKGFRQGATDAFAGFNPNLKDGYAAFQKQNAMAGAIGRGSTPPPRRAPKTITAFQQITDLYDEDDLLNANATGKKKGGKGRKGPSAANQLKSLQSGVDGLMKKLAEANDVWKLTQDYVADLTDEARVLLTDGSFAAWSKGLKNDMLNGKVGVDSLIAALENGGVSAKTLEDLKNRYGMDVKGIIGMLRAQQAEYEDSVKDATVKQMEKQYKQVDRLFKMIGKNNPVMAAKADFLTDIEEMGKGVLGADAFGDWFKRLSAGAMTGEDALGELRDAMYELPTETITALTNKYGLAEDDVATAIMGRVTAYKYANAEAEESMKFGAGMLRQMREEGALATLSERSQSIYGKVLEEVNRQKALGKDLNGALIDGLTREANATQDLIDKNQRLADLYKNNGVRGYINDIKSAGEAVNEMDKNVLQSMEDQLYDLATVGKFSFKAIFDTIHQGLVRFAAQSVIKDGLGSVFGQDKLNNGQPSLMGGLFKSMGFGDPKADPGPKVGHVGDAMKVYITNDGKVAMGMRPKDPKTGGVFIENPDGTLTPGTAGTSTLATPGFGTGTGLGGGISSGPLAAANDNAVHEATKATANSFQQTMGSVIPIIGMSFASSFKSPIAQIGGMFLSMMLTKMLSSQGGSGGGGIGGMIGSIAGLFAGGGGMPVPGAKEGGIVGSFVNSYSASPASFRNAPHYKEGTGNTSGIPAILHDNEAVIPLSRGRKVPVEMTGGSRGSSGQTIHNNFTINSPDADSFRKSKQQMAVDLHMASSRAARRR